MNYLGGFRNSLTLVLTGLDAEAKADLALRTMVGVGLEQARQLAADPAALAAASSLDVAQLSVELDAGGRDDPQLPAEAQSFLRLTVKDPDGQKAGKPFTAPVIEATLSSYPGMFPTTPPGPASPYGVYWPTTVSRAHVVGGGQPRWRGRGRRDAMTTQRLPLGTFVGARSGDKGGDANVGAWVVDPVEAAAVALAHGGGAALEVPEAAVALADARYAWLLTILTEDGVRALLPEARDLAIEVHALANLRAVNIVIHGLLGRGVAETTRVDPQAKGLGEHLRARLVDIPVALLDPEAS